jgi:hypothetical protein
VQEDPDESPAAVKNPRRSTPQKLTAVDDTSFEILPMIAVLIGVNGFPITYRALNLMKVK